MARLRKLCGPPATGPQKLALALAVLLTLSAGHRPAVAQAITEFPVPTANSEPIGITTGPDGALWFNEYSRQQDRAHHHRRCVYRIPDSHRR